jgi:hypothetical protein
MHPIIKIILALAACLTAAAPGQASWRRAESQNFIVYAEMPEARLREQVAVLEDYDGLLRSLTRTVAPPSPAKLRVYLVRGTGELQTVRPGLPRVAAGVYITNVDGIAAIADVRAETGGDPMAVLFHEYAHHFMMQHQGRVYPQWYIEGFAEFMMTARFTGRFVELGHINRVRSQALSNQDRWLPWERILFDGPGSPATLGQFYAQSWLLTHYLLNEPGRLAGFRAYIAALARAEDPRRAFEASFGITPKELEPRLRKYAFGGLTFVRMPRSASATAQSVKLEELPPSANDLLLLQAAMQVGLRDNGASLARIRSAAPRHSDAFARRVLAQAEALYGDGATADRLIDQLLVASPGDADLLYFRGMRYLRAAGAVQGVARAQMQKQAQQWFARAHRADKSHFQTLYRNVEAQVGSPALVSENNAETLLLAHTIAPQVADIRLAAARMLLLLGDYELAETILRPLVGTAHEGSSTGLARELLAKARARTNAGVQPWLEGPR